MCLFLVILSVGSEASLISHQEIPHVANRLSGRKDRVVTLAKRLIPEIVPVGVNGDVRVRSAVQCIFFQFNPFLIAMVNQVLAKHDFQGLQGSFDHPYASNSTFRPSRFNHQPISTLSFFGRMAEGSSAPVTLEFHSFPWLMSVWVQARVCNGTAFHCSGWWSAPGIWQVGYSVLLVFSAAFDTVDRFILLACFEAVEPQRCYFHSCLCKQH